MSYLQHLIQRYPKVSAAIGAAAVAAAGIYAPGSGPIVRDWFSALFGGG